jgi:hypothetical protein
LVRFGWRLIVARGDGETIAQSGITGKNFFALCGIFFQGRCAESGGAWHRGFSVVVLEFPLVDFGEFREENGEDMAGVVLLADHHVAGIPLEGLAVGINEQDLILGTALLGGFVRGPECGLDDFGGFGSGVGHARRIPHCANERKNFFPLCAIFFRGGQGVGRNPIKSDPRMIRENDDPRAELRVFSDRKPLKNQWFTT